MHGRSMLVAAAAALAMSGAAGAIEEMTLELASVRGAGWSAAEVALGFDLVRQRAHASIAQLELGALSQTLHDVRIDCPRLELSAAVLACSGARVSFDAAGLGRQTVRAQVRYARRNGSLELAFRDLRLGSGTAAVTLSLAQHGWRLGAQLQRVPLASLRQLASRLPAAQGVVAEQGLVTLSASARGVAQALHGMTVDATLSELSAHTEAGNVASEQLALRLKGSLERAADGWQFALALDAGAGQAYVQPVFLDFSAHRLAATAAGRLSTARELTLERFSVDHAGVARATGAARLAFARPQPLRSLELALEHLTFPGAYASYLQPLLLDTSFKAAETSGRLAGEIIVAEGAPRRVDLKLDDLSLDAGAGNIALTRLRGDWHWRAQEQPGPAAATTAVEPSRLEWGAGLLLGLELGGGALEFKTQGRQFELGRPARIAILDGALLLEQLRIRDAGLPQVAFTIDARLEPVSVARLCRAFGWPEFGGSLGGAISRLSMREGVLSLGSTLEAQVFGGRITLADLRLEEPFGQWPRFYSNVAFDHLDLELVTRAFSFGRITGRLSGAMAGLRLFNWMPVEFDARFYTPADDRSKHRISQRAVRNLGRVGGGTGAAAALSSGFLRFFADFNYERLGLSCRLERDVCIMDGVAPAPHGGYYLVKGRGVPRIDVIGDARRVDWPRLVQQLIAATRSTGPVVE